jgi:subtilisin family serine protease
MAPPDRQAELEIVIVDVERRHVKDPRIRVSAGHVVPAGPNRYIVKGVPLGRVEVSVTAEGFAPDHRFVEVVPGRNHVNVVLAESDMPAFRRRGGRVPFRSPEDQLGVATRGPEGAKSLEEWAATRDVRLEQPYGPSPSVITGDPAALPRLAREIRELPGIKDVGRLVNPGPDGTGMLTDRLVVHAEPGTSEEQLREAAAAAGCTVVRKLAVPDRWVVARDDAEDLAVLEAAETLEQHEFIVSVEPDIAFTADPDAINPTDQLYGGQWHLPRVGAPDAWQHLRDANPPGVNPGDPADGTFGASGIIVGVMDTGVESVTDAGGNVTAAHPEFQGTVVDGQTKVVTFFDFGAMAANNDNPFATGGDDYHGTACAGVAAAKADNPSGVGMEVEGGSGAAPNCRVLAAQGAYPMAETEYSDMYLWMAGIDPGSLDPDFPAQLAQGADVITNSWGGYNPAVWPISSLMDATFTQVADDGRGGRGTLMFFSTGNGSSPDFWTLRPFAAHPRTFGIGAVTDGDVKAGYSNWGDGVDLSAPSSGGAAGITTTTLTGQGTIAGHTGGGLDYIDSFGGTSSATPLTAGVAALLLSMDPTLTESEARTVLTRTAERIDYANADPDGHWRDNDGDGVAEYSWWYGFGMVDADRAVCVADNTVTVDSAVSFVDVPEAEPAIMPVTIRVRGWRPRTFEVIDGPNTTTGPANSFVLHAGSSVPWPGSFDCAEGHVYIWLRYTGTAAGDLAVGDITIRCVETGESFGVSLSANTVARVKTALVLALDRSGSMNDPAGDGRLKIELVRDSAAVVPILADDGTGLGAVSWDTDADLAGAMAVEDAGAEMGGAGRADLTTFIDNHDTNVMGLTAIGDAVEAAQTLLNASTGYASQAMVVLTDGNETAAKFLNDLTPDELHSRIYAIGVGTPENIQPASLAQLVGQQNGYLLMTGDIDANDTFLLTKYFQQILAGITNSQIVVDPQGFVTPGATLRLPFPVNETDREIDVIVYSPAPWLLDFQVEAPDGQVFGPPLPAGPGAQFVLGAGVALYRLAIPSPIVGPQDPTGSWFARLRLDRDRWNERWSSWYGKQPEAVIGRPKIKTNEWAQWAHRLRYAFTTQARSALHLDVAVTQSHREPGATARLRASLTEYGFPLETPATVGAVITRPDNGSLDLPLPPTSGGAYEASFIADAPGAWRVALRAEGNTSRGSRFTREALRSVAVWPGGNQPGPSTPNKTPIEQLLSCLCDPHILDPKVARKLGLNQEALCRCLRKHTRT